MNNSKVSYGLVEKLISIPGHKLALIKQLQVLEQPLLLGTCNSSVSSKLLDDFIFVKELDDYVAVEVHQILTKCFNTSTGDKCTQLTSNVNDIELVL